nr:hypothetical protein [uncultured Desulfuromonas sp.]
MQWLAYVIWSAMILCVLAAVVCYVLGRRRVQLPDAPAPICTGGRHEPHSSKVVDLARWQQLVHCCGFDAETLTQDPQERMRIGVDVLGVDPSWLQGKDTAMYPCLSFHNDVAAAVDFIEQHHHADQPLRLYAVKPEEVPLDESVYEASVVLCFARRVQIGDSFGWRYFPVNVYWEWGYPPEQMQCRQILYLARCAGCDLIGLDADMDDIYELLEGIAIPESVVTAQNAESLWPVADYAVPGQDVMGLTDCHLRSEQLIALIKEKGWHCVEAGTA